jgi:hypothetical protein
VGQPAHLRLTWIALLVLADRKGDVMSSVPGLAQDAGVTIAEVLQALDVFQKPDPFSRTPDNEGRRIVEIDGGWHVLNHDKYREMRSESQVKNAERQAKFKAKRRVGTAAFEAVSAAVTAVTGNSGNAPLCTLSLSRSLEDPDHPDPDPIPSDPAKDHPRARRVSSVSADAETLEVPKWWTGPKPRHAKRCRELGLDVELEAERFRATHFQQAFPCTPAGVDKRFDRWIVDPKFAAGTVATATPKRPSVGGTPWVHPDHAAFARENGLTLGAEVAEFRAHHYHPPDALKPAEVFRPFMDHLVRRAAERAPRTVNQ